MHTLPLGGSLFCFYLDKVKVSGRVVDRGHGPGSNSKVNLFSVASAFDPRGQGA